MKQYWQRAVLKIDALTLRERAIIFAMAALVVVTLVNQLLLDPLFRQQKILSQQMKQDQAKAVEIQIQIQQQVRMQAADLDAANRERLDQLTRQSEQMQGELNALQKALVSAERMPALLEELLKRNGKLRLVSLKTILPTNLLEGATQQTPAKEKAESVSVPVPAVYKHGVEIVVQGGYADMVAYMTELQSMPWQVFWAKAELDAKEYPKAQLTLVLYTLSLEKRWLNI